MSRRTVLFVIRTWAIGGGHTIIRLLLDHLPRDSYRILTVVFDAPGDGDAKFAAQLRDAGHTVIPEKIPWQSRGNFNEALGMLAHLVKKYEVDLVHTHDPQSNTLVGLGRKRIPCATVGSAYGWWDRLLPLRSHVYTWMEKNIALPRFERVITVSETMKRNTLKGRTKPDRLRVIPTGLDPTALDGGATREETRARIGIPQEAVVIGTTGRVYIEKGHKYLIEAFAKLAQNRPDSYLLIVGDGPMRPELEDYAGQLNLDHRVVFTGYYDDLPGALRAMDIFALATVLDEGFPTVVLEAQLAGLPVVATRRGGTHETMQEGKTGYLVPARDAEALAEALGTLVGDASLRQAMGTAGRHFVAHTYPLETMMQRVASAYDEAMEAYRPQ